MFPDRSVCLFLRASLSAEPCPRSASLSSSRNSFHLSPFLRFFLSLRSTCFASSSSSPLALITLPLSLFLSSVLSRSVCFLLSLFLLFLFQSHSPSCNPSALLNFASRPSSHIQPRSTTVIALERGQPRIVYDPANFPAKLLWEEI